MAERVGTPVLFSENPPIVLENCYHLQMFCNTHVYFLCVCWIKIKTEGKSKLI